MKKTVVNSIGIVFILSMIAKVIAFFKTIIQAYYFGATDTTDAFNIASGFASNIVYMITTALSVAFVPLYIKHKNTSNPYEQKKFTSSVLTYLLVLSFGFVLLLEIIAPLIVRFIAPEYSGELFNSTVKYLRVILIGFVFSLLTYLYQSVLDAEGIYGYTSVSSIVNSVANIVLIVLFTNTLGIWTLVIAIPFSYICQYFILHIKGKRFGKVTFKRNRWDKSLNVLMMHAIPILISQATVEINQVIDKALLTSVGDGAVTSVSYAAVLYQFVATLINVPLSTVLFTEIATAASQKNHVHIKNILQKVYSFAFTGCIPIIVVVFFHSFDIVNIIYGHGNFRNEAIQQTGVALVAYIGCVIPVTIKSVLSRAYYSMSDMVHPMWIGMAEVALNITLSFALVRQFGIIGVVGATTIASVVFMIVMTIDFNFKHIKIYKERMFEGAWKIIVATVGVIVINFFLEKVFRDNHFMCFVVSAIITFAIDFVILLILKEKNMYAIIEYVKKSRKNGDKIV